jgi:hypothetical protein
LPPSKIGTRQDPRGSPCVLIAVAEPERWAAETSESIMREGCDQEATEGKPTAQRHLVVSTKINSGPVPRTRRHTDGSARFDDWVRLTDGRPASSKVNSRDEHGDLQPAQTAGRHAYRMSPSSSGDAASHWRLLQTRPDPWPCDSPGRTSVSPTFSPTLSVRIVRNMSVN